MWFKEKDMTPLEKSKKLGVPLIGGKKWPLPVIDPNPVVAVCGLCGIEIREIMHFSCQRNGCPIQVKIKL